MNITIKRTVNLSEPVLPEVLSAPIYEGEKNAHTFALSAVKDKIPHALSGSVVAYFERSDGNTVRVEGETLDGCAILTLSPECYQTGVFYLAVMLIADGSQTVIYAASGRVRNTQDGEIIDGGNTIPTYDEIMAHLNKYLSTDITAKVEETEDGARITMKDVVNGETVALVKNGKPGENGATFRPTVSENGILSWANDQNLNNPEPVDIKGPKGDSVKVSRVDESTEDGGTNVVVFSNGATLRVQNGKTGAPGENGKSAYEVAKENGFEGTEEEWLLSLKGDSDKFFIIKLRVNPATTTAYYHGYKYSVIKEAIDAGKAVILIDPNGKVYTLNYVLAGEPGTNDNYFFHATAEYVKGANANQLIADTLQIATDNYAYIYKTELKAPNPRTLRFYDDSPKFIDEYDGSEAKQIYIPTKLKNPFALHIRGAVNADYDGSSETTVNIPIGDTTEGGTGGNASAFVVKVTYYVDHNDNGDESIYTADKTHAEIREAVERGDIVICELNYNYKANGATGSTGFDPLYLPYVTRSRNNLLCFAATFQNGFVFPYSGAESNHVVVTLDKNAKPNVYFKSFVHKSDLPYELPNPKYLIITQGTKIWNYAGHEEVKVDLDPPTTSLPWSAITGKPFGDGVLFKDNLTFSEQVIPIYTPFKMEAGETYKTSTGDLDNGGMQFTSTAVSASMDGLEVIGIGNVGAIDGTGDNGEPYALLNVPNGIANGGVKIYAMLYILSDEIFAMIQGATLPVKLELVDGATPIPEELIPTMSETVKGGAKVGEGLEVVDGALRVKPEGEYELIERIVCGYTLTSSQPSDWETNWTAYYTKGGTLREPVYTAITGSTAPAWKTNTYYSKTPNTWIIQRTQTPEGKEYSSFLKKMLVTASCPKGVDAGTTFNKWPQVDTRKGVSVQGTWTNFSHQSYDRFSVMLVELSKTGVLEVNSVCTQENPSLNQVAAENYFLNLKSDPEDTISRFYLWGQSSTPYNADAVIEIWGMKA